MARHIFYAAALAASVALPIQAFAAPPAPAPAPAPVAAAPPALSKDEAADVEKHITDLHDQLGITSQQQTQWDQFATVMRDNAAAMHAAVDDRHAKLADMTAADNMQSYADLAKIHAENMQKLASSFGTLFTSLSDEQKRTADSVFRRDHAKHEAAHKHTG